MRVQGVTRGIMSENTAVDTVSGLDYEEIEEAVMETARGRWFLTEFARMIDPSLAADEATLDWFVWMHRLSASPGVARARWPWPSCAC